MILNLSVSELFYLFSEVHSKHTLDNACNEHFIRQADY